MRSLTEKVQVFLNKYLYFYLFVDILDKKIELVYSNIKGDKDVSKYKKYAVRCKTKSLCNTTF